MKLTQSEFEAKLAAKLESLMSVYGTQIEAKAVEMGMVNAARLMDLCATNEPESPFKDGECSDEAIEFIADSVIGCVFG